jgi:predicted aldo/keto reductase-like oxidoreductase
MNKINRRDFMRQTAGVVAAATLAGPALGEPPAKLTATTLRPLGKTGIQCTLLGMGTGVKAWNGQSALTRKGDEAFYGLVRHAYASGIQYFDVADMYGSHAYMKKLMADGEVERDKITLLTKTVAREPEAVRADIERFRKELGTDVLDILLFHCLNEADWPEKMAACMDVLEEAKQKGTIRAHGISSHSMDAHRRAVETPWVDVMMVRINPYGVKMDGKPEEVVPIIQQAHDAGKGVLGIKIAGEGQLSDKVAECIKFVIGLGTVDAMPIGFLEPAEIDSAIAHIAAAT